MYIEPQLFEPEVVGVHLSLSWPGFGGWTLHVGSRRAGDPWSATHWERYTDLSASEALDVAAASLLTLGWEV